MTESVTKTIRMDRRLVENLLWPNTPWLTLVACNYNVGTEQLVFTIEGPADRLPPEKEIRSIVSRSAFTQFYPEKR